MNRAPQRIILTPKNLYRLLTGKLWRGNEAEILSRTARKGLTLVAFWQTLLDNVLPQELMDKLLPGDGRNPRVQSNLMNRTGTSPMPLMLRKVLLPSEAQLMRMSQNALGFLRDHVYRPSQFAHALGRFEDACFRDDVFITDSIRIYLNSMRRLPSALQQEPLAQAFQHGYHLAWLALLSLFGPLMGCDEITRLRMQTGATMEALYHTWRTRCLYGPQLLTGADRTTLLSPLPQETYVPLPLTPRMVAERMTPGCRLMLSGIGGCGKTELVRQTLALIMQQGTYGRIACVQYDQTLARSLLMAFPEKGSCGAEEIIPAVRDLLSGQEGGRKLLVIDNMDTTAEKETELLRGFPCDVLITSRMQELPGFQTLAVPPLEEEGALRVFSMESGQEMAACREDFQPLWQRVSGHPLMLRLLGRTCRARCWTTVELNRHLLSHGAGELHVSVDGRTQQLQQALAALYPMAHLTEQQQRLLRLIGCLRDTFWKPQALLPFVPDITNDVCVLADMLLALNNHGWLLYANQGYGMHPVVREALLPLSCDDVPVLWRTMDRRMGQETNTDSQDVAADVLQLLCAMEEWNDHGLSTAVSLELSMQSRPVWQFPMAVLDRHESHLNTHAHTAQDEINLCLGRMMVAYVTGNHKDLPPMVEALDRIGQQELIASSYWTVLLNLLECAGTQAEMESVVSLFEHLAPEDEESERMAKYLNFYGGYIRNMRWDAPCALEMLSRARGIIERLHLQGSLTEAANDTRMAYTLADMQRFDETLPLMRRVLTNLKDRGYSDDSQTVSASRNAYMFFLSKATKTQEGMSDLDQTMHTLEQQGLKDTPLYLAPMKMKCVMLHDLMLDHEAEPLAREIIALVRRHPELPAPDFLNAMNVCGRVLGATGHEAEGLGLLEEALNVANTEPSITCCILEGNKADILLKLGRRDEARRVAKHALQTAETHYPNMLAEVAFIRKLLEKM